MFGSCGALYVVFVWACALGTYSRVPFCGGHPVEQEEEALWCATVLSNNTRLLLAHNHHHRRGHSYFYHF
jgi:hypothetical protein